MGHPPVKVVASGAPPRTQATSGAPVMTVVESPKMAPCITLAPNSPPVVLLNEDGSPYTGGVDLIILAGQSLVRGTADVAGLAPQYKGPFENQKIWTGSTFEALEVSNMSPASPNADKHGPELGMAHRLQELGRTAYIFKAGFSGAGADYADPNTNNWFPELGARNAQVFDEASGTFGLKNCLDWLSANETSPIYSSILWLGNQADASSTYGYLYAELNILNLLDQFRRQLGVDAPIGIYRIPSGSTLTNLAAVRTAQNNVAGYIGNADLIDIDDAVLVDSVHPDSDSYLMIGERGADFVAGETGPEGFDYQNYRGPRSVLDPRVAGIGGATGCTLVTASSVANVEKTGQGVAIELTGTGSNGGRTMSMVTVDDITGSSGVEFTYEIDVGASPQGGVLFCMADSGGAKIGYFIRVTIGAITVFNWASSSQTQLANVTGLGFSRATAIPIRAKVEDGHLRVWYKKTGENWTLAVDIETTIYTSGGVALVTAWTAGDPGDMTFSMVRPY